MRLAALSLAAALLSAPLAHAQQGAFTTPAQHVAIMDAASGAILYCNDCQTPMPPASMSKIMTVLLVAEALEAGRITLDTPFTVSERAWRHGAMSDGSHMFLEINSTVSVRDLLRGAIIVSANDACIVLAEGMFGSEEAFVAEMNRRAQALGLQSARFRNSTGLPDPDHVISSADLARLARHLINAYPEIYRIYSERDFTYNRRTQQNRNPLLGAFTGADGVKTGHTKEAGYCLTASAVQNGRRLILVIMGLPSEKVRAEESERLLAWGFREFSTYKLFAAGDQVDVAPVFMGEAESVPLVLPQDVEVNMLRSARDGMTVTLRYDSPLVAPIAAGQVVGAVVVATPGTTPMEFPVVAGQTVEEKGLLGRMVEGVMNFIGG